MIKLLCTSLSTVKRSNNWRPWSRQSLALLLLLVWLPAQAANYSFTNNIPTDNIPAVCTGPVSDVYTCSPLTLAAGDTITITGPTAITVSGDFTTGNFTQINAAGDSTDLTITVTGITELGASTILKGNIIGNNATTGTITIGANSQVEGDLTTTTAGVINIGADSVVVGDLNTLSGAINVGDRSTVTGSIKSSLAGVITIGADSVVGGDLTTLSGAINVGDRSTVNGSILSSLAGAVTIGVHVIAMGDVATTYEGSEIGAGAITINSGSEVAGSVTTNTGAITVGVDAKVAGNVSANDGAITVEAGADIAFSTCTGNSGAITIGTGANVGGNVETATAGAITIGALANVTGGVTVHKAGARTIGAGATVGERMDANCEIIAPHILPPGTILSPPRIISRQWRQILMR
jgi:hypothetical protein